MDYFGKNPPIDEDMLAYDDVTNGTKTTWAVQIR